MTIRAITDYGCYRMEEDSKENDGHGWVFSDEELEPTESITVTRCGNKVIATNALGESAEAKCHPEDDFSFETGVKLAVERLFEKKKIKVGDKVKVIDDGLMYTTFTEWVIENIDDKERIARYAYDIDEAPEYWCEVVAIAKNYGRELAYIEERRYPYRCYLIGVEGLKMV